VTRKKDDDIIPDFDQVPKEFGKQKPGDYMAVRRSLKQDPLPGVSCEFKPSWDLENLDIIRTNGRESFSVVTYSADQVYNYRSQSQRYDDSIYEVPAYVTPQPDGSTIYGFCSNLAGKGFWEVVVGGQGNATFITLTPGSLTILCPTPFLLSQFVVVDSDSTTYSWTQIAGSRTVLIDPANVKYPNIDIQASCYTSGCDSMSQSPIILRVETDNPLVFTDLIIFNRPTDFFYGLGYIGIQDTEISSRKVGGRFRVPPRVQAASVWVGDDVPITWMPPMSDSEFIVRYRVQKFIPPYTDNQVFPPDDVRLAIIQANSRYRIVSDFSILGSETSSTGDPFSYVFPDPGNITIYADDSTNQLGYAFISSSYDTVTFGNQVRDVIDDMFNLLGYAFMSSSYQKIDLGGIVIG
jgi:hypothetical protein